MKTSTMLILAIPIVILLILLGGILNANFHSYTIEGLVSDCQTNQPIGDVEVSLSERGWGLINGSLVWDKDYTYNGKVDAYSHFTIVYKGSPTHIIAKKDGYFIADEYHDLKSPLEIKIMKATPPIDRRTDDCQVSKL